METKGYRVRRNHDADESGKTRQQEVGRQNRYTKTFESKTNPPASEIGGGSYLNTDEVEFALEQAASPNTDFTEIITLPNPTWEGRQSHDIKMGKGSEPNRTGVYFLGGVHAREWGSSDILVNFIEKVSQAYRTNAGLNFGGKSFTSSQIQDIINGLDIFIFPQANPDGRYQSMTSDAMWRKNRRPASLDHPDCIGVDINRNYNFLWNYPKYFRPDAAVQSSTDPCDYQVYIGPSAASEPETKNVIWIQDNNPGIRFFIDIHSYGEDILCNWGDSKNQTTDPNMNFRNPGYDGKRGVYPYKEFIPPADKSTGFSLAQSMASAIQAVRGRTYTVEQEYSLYPTSGTSEDYSFSRYFVDNNNGKIVSYTIEWGSPDNPTPFHPSYSEMYNIIQEITASLIQFCIDTLKA